MNASALLPKQQHLDLERFQLLNADLSIFPAVARVFISVLPDWRKEMQRAIVWTDVQAVCDSLHKMKGSCSMMGAEQLPRWPPKFPRLWPPQTPPPELIGDRG
jgi:HPt (histidine-containing phosphotransfer) domain-containing protein